jgi:hypothetical protein
MAAAASVDPWDQGGTYTKAQLEGFRGPLDGNGHGPPEVSNGLETSPVGACLQCQGPLYRPGQKWCGDSCRARYRRAHLEPAQVERSTSAPAAEAGTALPALGAQYIEYLCNLAQGLPAGWRLEATADTVTLVWTR